MYGLVRDHREVGVEEPLGLLDDGVDHPRVPVAGVDDAHASGEVDEDVAVDVRDRRVLGALGEDRQVHQERMRDHAHLALGERTRARPRDLGADLDRLRRRHLHPAYPSLPTVDSGRGRLAREPRPGPAGDPRGVARRGARGRSPRAGGGGARHRDDGRARPRCAWCSSEAPTSTTSASTRTTRAGRRRSSRRTPWPRSPSTGARRFGARCASRGRWSASRTRSRSTYFRTRARESRLGAWASPQSRPLADRGELDRLYADVEERFAVSGRRPAPTVVGRLPRRPARDRAVAEPRRTACTTAPATSGRATAGRGSGWRRSGLPSPYEGGASALFVYRPEAFQSRYPFAPCSRAARTCCSTCSGR